MTKQVSLTQLKARLKSLNDEKETIEKLIAIYEHKQMESVASPSIRGQVVDAVIELIKTNNKYVSTKEIFAYIEKKKLLKDEKDKKYMLAIILSQEAKKKNPRLKQLTRGVYDIA